MTQRRYGGGKRASIPLGLGVLVLMAYAGIWAMASGIGSDQSAWYIIPFYAAWFSILALAGYRMLTASTEVRVHEGDEIEFISWLREVRVRAQDIQSVEMVVGRQSYILVRYTGGKTYLGAALDDFHEFLSELKKANPGVNLVGC